MVLLLGKVAVDPFACLADLLRDNVSVVAFDDALDSWVFVARDQDEPVAVGDDPLVLGRPDVDLAETAGVITFAVKRQRRLDLLLLCALIDSIIHVAKDLFVACCTLSEIHCAEAAGSRVEPIPVAASGSAAVVP